MLFQNLRGSKQRLHAFTCAAVHSGPASQHGSHALGHRQEEKWPVGEAGGGLQAAD